MYKNCRQHGGQYYWFNGIENPQNLFNLINIEPGVDVMITIFCDFRQFSAKKIAVFP
jgi:hypothetical protein